MATATSDDGTTIEWDERGTGSPVLLVHGITETMESWAPVTERLAADHRVLTLDLRGHGRSGRADRYDLAAMAGDVIAVIGSAGAERPHIVGHSLGGAVVSAVGAAFPVASVTNVDQPLQLAGFKDQLVAMEGQLRDPDAFPHVMTAVFEAMAGELLPPTERSRIEGIRRSDQEVVLGVWALLLDQSADDVARSVDSALAGYATPYLSLFGIDPGPEYAAWLASRIPGAQVELWEGHGHYPHLVDPDRFVARLHQFWSSIPV